jgi:hypothetical protein
MYSSLPVVNLSSDLPVSLLRPAGVEMQLAPRFDTIRDIQLKSKE